jgi:hypothetical protein
MHLHLKLQELNAVHLMTLNYNPVYGNALCRKPEVQLYIRHLNFMNTLKT